MEEDPQEDPRFDRETRRRRTCAQALEEASSRDRAQSSEGTLGEIEEGSPYHRLQRGQHFRGNYGGNRVGRIVKPIDIVKHKR